jgi:hypothetical protein
MFEKRNASVLPFLAWMVAGLTLGACAANDESSDESASELSSALAGSVRGPGNPDPYKTAVKKCFDDFNACVDAIPEPVRGSPNPPNTCRADLIACLPDRPPRPTPPPASTR